MTGNASHHCAKLNRLVRSAILAALAFSIAVAIPTTGAAQVLYGTLVGNVQDPTGAVVPGATVTVTQTQTALTRQGQTDSRGGYTISTLSAGTYTVKIEARGFKTFAKSDVPVAINTVSRVDATLQIGAVSQTVEVSASAAVLQTDRADVHHDITATTLEQVPLPPGNNFQSMMKTLPGVTPPTTAHSIPTNPTRALDYSVNGTSDYGNTVRIDGVTQYNIWVPENTSYIPSSDAIQVVNVTTADFNPEQGMAGGSTTNVEIKSGTNQIHGDLYEYHFDNNTEAHNFFDPNNKITRKPKDIFNQFGASIGGPIKKDKLFYFSNVEWTRQRQFATATATIPTLAMMAGDLQGNDPANGLNANSDIVFDPTTGNADGTGRTQIYATNDPNDTAHYNALCTSAQCLNMVPTSRISPTATTLLNLLQQAPGRFLQSASTSAPNDNYLAATSFAFNRFTTDDKVNWNATDKFTMYGHIGFLKFDDLDPQQFGEVGGDPISSYGGNEGHGYGHTLTFTVTSNYVASPHFVVDGSFGMTRQVSNSAQLDITKNQGLDVLGIPGVNGTRIFEGSWPRFAISNFDDLGTHNTYMPYFRNDPQFLWSGNASWIHSNHTIRFGGAYYVTHLNHAQPEWNGGGSTMPGSGGFAFGAGPTQCQATALAATPSVNNCFDTTGKLKAGKGSTTNAYNDLATFLLGLDTAYGKNIMVPDEFHTVTHQLSLYVGDQWQTTHKLTTQLGLRWEYYPIPTRGGSRGLERYDFAKNMVMLCGVGNIPTDCGTSVSKTLFDPIVGLAYRVTPSFVVRAGYSLTNEPYNLADDLRTNYPILIPLYISADSYQATGVLDAASLINSPVGSSLPIGIPLPATPDLTQPEVPIPGNVNLATTVDNLQRGYIQSWNLTLEKELPHGWQAQAGYVATRTIRQLGFQDLNAETPIGPAGCTVGTDCGGHASQPLNYLSSTTGCSGTASTAIGCRTGVTSLIAPIANNHYDALQSVLRHQFAHGYQVMVAYTWSKNIGMAGVTDEKASAYIQTPAFYYLNRGLSPWDRPQNLQALFIGQSPFGAGKRWMNTGIGSKLLGGWQISGVLSKVSGSVFRINSGGSSSTNLNASVGNSQRPDLVKSSIDVLSVYGPHTTWFDTSAFAAVADKNRFGTSPFYPLHGPPLFDLDVALARNFKLTERFNLQFRAQSINFTNTPHFGNPTGDFNSSNFGRVNGLANTGRDGGVDARQFIFTAKLSF
ncbi:MAG TPA: TonB-dependent receptor [Terriglobia bacterium]|nr:TonB-dependent receptor [Terriglobia bacterium]